MCSNSLKSIAARNLKPFLGSLSNVKTMSSKQRLLNKENNVKNNVRKFLKCTSLWRWYYFVCRIPIGDFFVM